MAWLWPVPTLYGGKKVRKIRFVELPAEEEGKDKWFIRAGCSGLPRQELRKGHKVEIFPDTHTILKFRNIQKTSTPYTQRKYTPCLSRLIYIQRLLFLGYALPCRSHPPGLWAQDGLSWWAIFLPTLEREFGRPYPMEINLVWRCKISGTLAQRFFVKAEELCKGLMFGAETDDRSVNLSRITWPMFRVVSLFYTAFQELPRQCLLRAFSEGM